MKVNKNKILSNIAAIALLSAPAMVFAVAPTATGAFTVSATVNAQTGIVCNGSSIGASCALGPAPFGANPATYYTGAAHSYYYSISLATDLTTNPTTGNGKPVNYTITDSNTSAATPCDGASGSATCFHMNGTTSSSNHLPFSVGYQSCGGSMAVFTPGAAPIPIDVANSSISLAGACTNLAATSTTPSTSAPSGSNFGILQVSIPQQASAPAPDTYSDTVTINVCDQSGSAACV